MRYTKSALGLLNAQYRSVLKKCLLINLGLFALGAGISTADATVTLSPTLDSLKEQAKDISSDTSYTLTKLNSDENLPEGAAKVTINKETYYFTPSSDKDLLQTLAGTSAGIITGEGGTPKSISFDVSKLPASVFSYADGTEAEDDHNFVVQEADQDGKITTKYYKVVLNTDKLSTSGGVAWSEVDSGSTTGNIKINLPNENTPTTLYYTVDESKYDPTLGTRLNDLTRNVGSETKKVLFEDLKISDSYSVYGGAIHNSSDGGYSIYADFIDNYTKSGSYAYGGAVYNHNTIGNITGDFIGNHASSSYTYSSASGGAIYNSENGTIGTITGDFIGNYVSSSGTVSYASGGAVYNSKGTIGDITGDFIGNHASSSDSAGGGVVYNSENGTIGTITGDFIGNYVSSSFFASGGAVYNYGTIGNITGDFIGNYASSVSGNAQGSAIYNEGTIGDITGDFIGNSSSSNSYSPYYTYYARGGAIYNERTIGDITGDFIGNHASSEYVSDEYANGGGAIYNPGTIGDITGDFIGNHASSVHGDTYGGAIYNGRYFGTIGNITGDFIGNHASSENGEAKGGAIYNPGTIGDITGDFIGNYASSENGEAKGGAIYNSGTITITGYSTFTDNYVEVNGKKTSNAIYNEGTINFNGTNIVVNDAITGENGTINIASSSNGMTTFNNSVSGNTVNLEKGTLNLKNGSELANVENFVANSGVLNVGDQTVSLKNATFNDGSTLAINVKSDGNGLLKADSLTVNGGQLKATLGQGIVADGSKTVTLLESGTEFVNNFADVMENNMYVFEKADKAGDYIISLAKTAEEVSQENGGTQNNTGEAKAWVDGNKFEQGSVSADVADKLADLAQNDGKKFNEALSALAPGDTPEVRTNSVNNNTEMFRAVVSHLDDVSKKKQYGLSSGDVVDGVSVWAKAFGNHAKVDDTSKAYGFKSDGYGATLGIEKQLDDAFKVGLGYSYFYNDVDGFMRDSDVNTHTGFVYGEYRQNDWYTNAIASYGYSKYDENKHVTGDVYKAKYDVDNIGAQVMTGYNANVAKVDVTPEAGLRYNNIHRDNYVDGAGQSVKAETMDVMTAVAGLKVGKDLVSCFGLKEVYWRPEARLAATYDLISDKENAVVSLSNGSGYVVKGQRLNRFGIEAGADVTFHLSPDVESSVGYEGKFRKDYQDHTGYVSAKYKF